MIELLILYSLNKRGKTAYNVRKNIIEFFGSVSEPSFGTIHPALKRLEKEEYITSKPDFTDGGRKSTYFNITPKGKIYAKSIFKTELSDNPITFKTQFNTMVSALSLIANEDRIIVLDNLFEKLEIHKVKLENILKDEYIELDEYQNRLHKKLLNEINNDLEFLKELKKCQF